MVDTDNEALGASTNKEEFDDRDDILDESAWDDEVDWCFLDLMDLIAFEDPLEFCVFRYEKTIFNGSRLQTVYG